MNDPGRDIFQNALSDFTFEAACGGAIRHLADSGCTVKQIMERLDYPISGERVRIALYKHLCDTNVILEKSPEEELPEAKPEYVLEYNSYGKPSYRRKNTVSTEGNASGPENIRATWEEVVYKPATGSRSLLSGGTSPKKAPEQSGQGMLRKAFRQPGQGDSGKPAGYPARGTDLSAFLTGYCDKERDELIYISCDFGIPDSAAAKGISLLNGRQQEYLEGILWPRHRIYHRLDHRMKEILCSLYEQNAYDGICYFISQRKKMYIQ